MNNKDLLHKCIGFFFYENKLKRWVILDNYLNINQNVQMCSEIIERKEIIDKHLFTSNYF